MPATRPTTIHQRQEILRLVESGMTVKTIAQHLQLARRTVRKWRQRAAHGGVAALVTRAGRPASGPLSQGPPLVRYLALRLKRQHASWGAGYLVKKMSEHSGLRDQPLPNPSTVWRYWRRFGDRLLAHRPRPTPQPPASGVVHGVWQLDFKESLPLGGVGPTTITHARDLVGRATVCHRVHPAERPHQRIVELTTAQVQADCRIAFTQWGLPDSLRTDHASIFQDDDPSPFPTRLSLWWIGLAITPQFIRHGVPQDNGGVERAHRTADERTFQGQDFTDATHLQQQLDADWHELNFECPSRARGCHGQPPVVAHPQLLQPRREYRPEWEARLFDLTRVRAYLAGRQWVRAVSGRGQVRLGNYCYTLGLAWRQQTVSIQFDPSQHDFIFTLIQPDDRPALSQSTPQRRPAQGLSLAALMGPVDLTLDQSVRQLTLPFELFANPPATSVA